MRLARAPAPEGFCIKEMRPSLVSRSEGASMVQDERWPITLLEGKKAAVHQARVREAKAAKRAQPRGARVIEVDLSCGGSVN